MQTLVEGKIVYSLTTGTTSSIIARNVDTNVNVFNLDLSIKRKIIKTCNLPGKCGTEFNYMRYNVVKIIINWEIDREGLADWEVGVYTDTVSLPISGLSLPH